MARLTNVLLNCQTASYGEIFNVVDYILMAPLEGSNVYQQVEEGRPTATLYLHLRMGGAQGGNANADSKQMVYHQCMLAQFAIIARAIRDLPTTSSKSKCKAAFMTGTSNGSGDAGLGGGLTASYTATLHCGNTVQEDTIHAQDNSLRALELAHHAMATAIQDTSARAGDQQRPQSKRKSIAQQVERASTGHATLARGNVVISTVAGDTMGLQYIITSGTGAAQDIPHGVTQVDINAMSVAVAATIARQVVRARNVNGAWWGGFPRMFFEFIRSHAAIAPGSKDPGATPGTLAAATIPVDTWWSHADGAQRASAKFMFSAAKLAPGGIALWGAGLVYRVDPNWNLAQTWGAAQTHAAVLQRDDAPGRNPPHLIKSHATEVLAMLKKRPGDPFKNGTNQVTLDGLEVYRQKDASRKSTPPWIAAAVAMLRFFILSSHTMVIGRRSSILEAAYVCGIGVYVMGDGEPVAKPHNWNPIFAEQTEQAPTLQLTNDDLVPIGCWRRPRTAPFAYLSTAHRLVAYHLLNGKARPLAAPALPNLYPPPAAYQLGGAPQDYLVHHLVAGPNQITIEVTAEIV